MTRPRLTLLTCGLLAGLAPSDLAAQQAGRQPRPAQRLAAPQPLGFLFGRPVPPRTYRPVRPRPKPSPPRVTEIPLPPPRPRFPDDPPIEATPAVPTATAPAPEQAPSPAAPNPAAPDPTATPAGTESKPGALAASAPPLPPEKPADLASPAAPPVPVMPSMPEELPTSRKAETPAEIPAAPPAQSPSRPVPLPVPPTPGGAAPPTVTTPAMPPVPPRKPPELATPGAPGVAPSGAKLGEVRQPEDDATCPGRLKARNVDVEPTTIGPQPDDRCTVVQPVHLIGLALPGGGKVEFPEHPTIACTTADAFSFYVRDLLVPLAKGTFGSPVAKVWTGPGLECRSRDHILGAKLSSHGQGLAIDIAQLKLADGRMIEIGTPKGDDGQAFETSARAAACGFFHTVLGPGSDSYHRTHWHFDLEVRGSHGDSKYCK